MAPWIPPLDSNYWRPFVFYHGQIVAGGVGIEPTTQRFGDARTSNCRPPKTAWGFSPTLGVVNRIPTGGTLTYAWKPQAESHRCVRVCSPAHSYSAMRLKLERRRGLEPQLICLEGNGPTTGDTALITSYHKS